MSRGLLLVDGSALAFFVLDSLAGEGLRELGGDYAKIGDRAVEIVKGWLRYGHAVEIVADGSADKFKKEELLRRRDERLARYFGLYTVLESGESPAETGTGSATWQRLPPPPMFFNEVYGRLLEFCEESEYGSCVKMTKAKGEADMYLAKRAVQTKLAIQAKLQAGSVQQGYPVYVVSQDSDFFFVENISYVPLDSIDATTGAAGVVYTRSKLAKEMGLEPSAMTDLALALGNDFLGNSKYRKFLDVGKIVKGFRNKSYKLDIPDDMLERAQYIRDFYSNVLGEDDLDLQVEGFNNFLLAGELDDLDAEENESPEILVFRGDLPKRETVTPAGASTQHNQSTIVSVMKVLQSRCKKYATELADQNFGQPVDQARIYMLIRAAFSRLCQSFGWEYEEDIVERSFMLAQAKSSGRDSDYEFLVQAPETRTRSGWQRYCLCYAFQRISIWILQRFQVHLQILPSMIFDYHAFFYENSMDGDSDIEESNELKFARTEFGNMVKEETNPTTQQGRGSTGRGGLRQFSTRKKPATSPKKPEEQAPVAHQSLPVDEHRQNILSTIHANRVTVIHGETGSGKSSRIPLFIMEACSFSKQIMVSQGRRIAARSLRDRVQNVLGGAKKDLVGLRMGGGCVEETQRTKLWYVTTGYLVRKLASSPSYFDNFSYLILDEIHERSTDTDIVCLLVKRLLDTNKEIRVVLMSATIQADLFRDYFSVRQPALFVGAKRFQLTVHTLDSPGMMLALPESAQSDAITLGEALDQLARVKPIIGMTNAQRASNPDVQMQVTPRVSQLQNRICVELVHKLIHESTSAILVFVGGMADIVDLTTAFDDVNEVTKFTNANTPFINVIPIHSSIPYEEQMDAWSEPKEREVKVIIATNSAESSLTLPDVDTVICLGIRREVEFNQESKTSGLAYRWISKASATQRAGRTGRTRPGVVYRLYTNKSWEMMNDFDLPEIHSSPLENVVLDMKSFLEGAVIPMLRNVIDPPSLRRTQDALTTLFDQGFIDSPEDEVSALTSLGKFVSRLGIDLHVGGLVARGAALGCIPESIAIAAALSVPQGPFRVANPIKLRDLAEYHSLISTIIETQLELGGGINSDPLVYVRLISIWHHCPSTKFRRWFCNVGGLVYSRMRQLYVVYKHLLNSVVGATRKSEASLAIPHPAELFSEPKKFNRVLFTLFSSKPGNVFSVKTPTYSDVDAVNVRTHQSSDLLDVSKKYTIVKFTAPFEPPQLSELNALFPPTMKWYCGFDSKTFGASLGITVDEYRSRFEENIRTLIIHPDNLIPIEDQYATLRGLDGSPVQDKPTETYEFTIKTKGKKNTEKKSGSKKTHPVVWTALLSYYTSCPSDDDSSDYGEDDSSDYGDDDSSDYGDDYFQYRDNTCEYMSYFMYISNHPAVLESFLAEFDTRFEMKLFSKTSDIVCYEIFKVLRFTSKPVDYHVRKWWQSTLAPGIIVEASPSMNLSFQGYNFELKKQDLPLFTPEISSVRSNPATADKRLFFLEKNLQQDSGYPVEDIPAGVKLLLAYAAKNKPNTKVDFMKANEKTGQFTIANVHPQCTPLNAFVPSSIGEHESANINVSRSGIAKAYPSRHGLASLAYSDSHGGAAGFAGIVTCIKSKGERTSKVAICDQMTVLPDSFGKAWIGTALACVNASPDSDFLPENEEACESVAELLWDDMLSSTNLGKPNQKLINLVNLVFEDFKLTPRKLDPSYYEEASRVSSPTCESQPDADPSPVKLSPDKPSSPRKVSPKPLQGSAPVFLPSSVTKKRRSKTPK
eukprot:CAMPEP_0203746210 /NCGR_PEP_ID=MMETSP0098-20131031/1717_1 /ASSEMBLY_ACC=CAM_ASM_000208 /TAXON_ID=96639 /ORGANISM=" , Strain NY0313808BC1" /LENGTH=1770 /DNA_ID=CAMNT_0050634215 /DNA_START=136 /DNA_END=5448 /DNA_ORIENTATION=+